MFAVEKSKKYHGKCTPNILPCRINHNGPVNASKRYWNPTVKDGKPNAYFRGRKLHGKKLVVPKGYRGVVLAPTERILPKQSQEPTTEADDVEDGPEVKVMEIQSEFDGLIVWGHEALPDETADPYVRGMEEWIGLADQIHSFDGASSGTSGKSG